MDCLPPEVFEIVLTFCEKYEKNNLLLVVWKNQQLLQAIFNHRYRLDAHPRKNYGCRVEPQALLAYECSHFMYDVYSSNKVQMPTRVKYALAISKAYCESIKKAILVNDKFIYGRCMARCLPNCQNLRVYLGVGLTDDDDETDTCMKPTATSDLTFDLNALDVKNGVACRLEDFFLRCIRKTGGVKCLNGHAHTVSDTGVLCIPTRVAQLHVENICQKSSYTGRFDFRQCDRLETLNAFGQSYVDLDEHWCKDLPKTLVSLAVGLNSLSAESQTSHPIARINLSHLDHLVLLNWNEKKVERLCLPSSLRYFIMWRGKDRYEGRVTHVEGGDEVRLLCLEGPGSRVNPDEVAWWDVSALTSVTDFVLKTKTIQTSPSMPSPTRRVWVDALSRLTPMFVNMGRARPLNGDYALSYAYERIDKLDAIVVGIDYCFSRKCFKLPRKVLYHCAKPFEHVALCIPDARIFMVNRNTRSHLCLFEKLVVFVQSDESENQTRTPDEWLTDPCEFDTTVSRLRLVINHITLPTKPDSASLKTFTTPLRKNVTICFVSAPSPTHTPSISKHTNPATDLSIDSVGATDFYVRGRDGTNACLTRVRVGFYRFESSMLRYKSALSMEECAALVEKTGMDYANSNPSVKRCVFGR